MESRRFRFGLFEFDAAIKELRREGVLVRLPSQPAQLLACLIEHAGRTVSREQLCKTLWGDSTFVDFDRGLNFCISQIRLALKDDSVEPTYIRTVPKQGYQFIAPVERIAEPAPKAGEPVALAGQVPRSQSYRRMVALAGAAAVVAVLILAAGYRLRSGPAVKPAPIVAVLRFDNETDDPALTRFGDALTDNVVEQLTAQNQNSFGIIGNANILRRAREQRDLREIGNTLRAKYVVLGQVQRQSNHTRILAHLIRLPEQTHLWVVRIDRDAFDPMSLEAEAAQKIATQFSSKLATDARSPLPALGSR